MPESKDPLGHDPLEALQRDSIWAFEPSAPGAATPGAPPQSILPAAPTPSPGGTAPSAAIPAPSASLQGRREVGDSDSGVGSPGTAGPPGAASSPLPKVKPPEKSAPAKVAPTPVHHLVTFGLGAELFGIDIKQIQEIIRHQEVCPVPNTPPYMEGLINLRGRILPVINLRRRLAMTDNEPEDSRNRRIIIVAAKGSLIGLLVDTVKEVLHLPVSVVEPPGSVAAPEAMEYIIGVGKLEDSRLLSILDLEKLLADV